MRREWTYGLGRNYFSGNSRSLKSSSLKLSLDVESNGWSAFLDFALLNYLISLLFSKLLYDIVKLKEISGGGPRVPPGRHGTKLFTSLPSIVSQSAFLVWVHGPISLQRFGITNYFRHVGPYCEPIQWMPRIVARQIDLHCNHYDHGKMILEQPTHITTLEMRWSMNFLNFFDPPSRHVIFSQRRYFGPRWSISVITISSWQASKVRNHIILLTFLFEQMFQALEGSLVDLLGRNN